MAYDLVVRSEGDEMEKRQFDLNIEEMLSHWKPEHAVRELIANALDEQLLTGSAEVEIQAEGGGWTIRDHGRGLRAEHFTMNENPEKAGRAGIIGRFGVGLKDALATLHRAGATVEITSRHGLFRPEVASKHGFDGIATLHVTCLPSPNASMAGTAVRISGIRSDQVHRAKTMFLRFAGLEVLDSTPYGQVLKRDSAAGHVYINGVRAADEPSFLFSYNVTDLTPAMEKALSRERIHIGRTVYGERVKSILVNASAPTVIAALADQVRRRDEAAASDEMSWAEVRQKATRALAELAPETVFVTREQLEENRNLLDDARQRGRNVIVLTEDDLQRAQREGASLTYVEGYREEYQRSFRYDFVDEDALGVAERAVFEAHMPALRWFGADAARFPVRVSRNLREDCETLGVWDPQSRAIVVHRSTLRDVRTFLGTLLHELAHARSHADDVTREFEEALSGMLGELGRQLLAARTTKSSRSPSRQRRNRDIRGVAKAPKKNRTRRARRRATRQRR